MRCGRTDRNLDVHVVSTSSNQATTLESQTTHRIQYVLGQTLRFATMRRFAIREFDQARKRAALAGPNAPGIIIKARFGKTKPNSSVNS